MQHIQDDEIDLVKIFQTLWDSKWLIIAFTLIAMLIGAGYIYSKKPVYESKLTYTLDNIPPFYDNLKVYADFKKNFYSKKNFDDWRKIIGKTLLVFEDFSNTEVINGFVITRPQNRQLATIKDGRIKKIKAFVLIKTNQLPVLEDFFKYAYFISEYLNKDYIDRAQDELKIMELRYKDLSSININETVLPIDRFVVNAKRGANLFLIQHPTIPEKKSPRSRLILFVSLILGGMIGVFYVLISNSISNRKE